MTTQYLEKCVYLAIVIKQLSEWKTGARMEEDEIIKYKHYR